jgi:hypothetical protein
MKKRKLTKEERKRREEARKRNAQVGLLLLASAEKLTEQGRKAEPRPSVKDVLYVAKIMPNWNTKPAAIAKYLAQELSDSPSLGARKVAHCIELGQRVNEQRFVGRMLIALGEYLVKGKPIFDAVDVEVAKIKIQQPNIRYSEVVSKLKKLHPDSTRFALERRVSRLLESIPKEWNI